MPRKPIVGGNWKCNGTVKSGKELMDALNAGKWDEGKVDVIICPVALQAAAMAAIAKPSIKVALQNCSMTGMGAFTGEHSVEHIKDAGIEWVVIGHSERRSLYGETDEMCAKKLARALEVGLKVLYCIGEKLPEREAGKTNEVCAEQMGAVFALNLTPEQWSSVVIAYEPVWAIGTGKVATPAQAQDAHDFIRKHTAEKAGSNIAADLRIQYGGSVSPDNCAELIACPDIDGFLVGGASLKPSFVQIIQTAAGEA